MWCHILSSAKKERDAKTKKLCMFYVSEIMFLPTTRKVLELVLRNKRVLTVLVGSVMSLYEGAKTGVRVIMSYQRSFR